MPSFHKYTTMGEDDASIENEHFKCVQWRMGCFSFLSVIFPPSFHNWNQGTLVCTPIRLRAGRTRNLGSISIKGKIFSLLHFFQTGVRGSVVG